VDFKKLAQSASNLVNKRGGTKALQEDANELMDIAKGDGSMSDKAKRGAEAIKEPGAHRDAPAGQQPTEQPATGQQPDQQTGPTPGSPPAG